MLLKSKQVPIEFPVEPKKFKKYHKIHYKVLKLLSSAKTGGAELVFTKQTVFNFKQLLVILKLLKPTLKLMNKTARVRLIISLDTIITKKAKDIRMGRGKGAPAGRVFSLSGGKALLSLYGLQPHLCKKFLSECNSKLSTSATIINKYE